MTATYDRADFHVSVHPTGENFLYEIEVTGTFPTPGWMLNLAYGNQGFEPNPRHLFLDVIEVALPGAWPEVITRIVVRTTLTGMSPLDDVTFILPDGAGSIVVEIPPIS
jgi:hypothetical protein